MPLDVAEQLAKLVDGGCETCGGSGQARHPQTGQYTMAPCPTCGGTGGDEEAVIQNLVTKLGTENMMGKAKKGVVQDALGGEDDPRVTQGISATLSRSDEAAIDALFSGVNSEYINKSALVAQLEAQLDGITDPALKEQAGEAITLAKLSQFAEAQKLIKDLALVGALGVQAGKPFSQAIADTAAAVARAQAEAAGQATPGRSGGAGLLPVSDPRAQLGNLGASAGSPEAGQPQLAYKAIRKLEKQLKKAVDPLERAMLGDEITRAKLSAAHTAGMI
jgi:hypothetical protein